MSQINKLHQTASEVKTLEVRGYKLVSLLGKGSYANVYMAEYRRNDDSPTQTLACKVVDKKMVSKNFGTKFLPREIEVLGKVKHPHIIEVISIFTRRDRFFIFMRFAEEGDLLDIIIKDGAISERKTRFWSHQIILALQYLHRIQIAHRDIKCENILITRNHNVKLCDFGFTRYVVDKNNNPVLSETFCGSLTYAAPEILKGSPYAPKISDLWAFGVMLFTMLNKSMPFDETNVTKLYGNQMRKRFKYGFKVKDKISSEAKALIGHLLEPDVKRRLTVEDVVRHTWYALDPQLMVLNKFAIEASERAEGSLVDDHPIKSSKEILTRQENVQQEELHPVSVLKEVSKTPSVEAKRSTEMSNL